MKIAELREASAAHARHVKEQRVREVRGRAGHTDINTMVEVFRAGVPVAAVFTQPDRDVMLGVASIAAAGFGADALALTFESFSVTGKGDSPEAAPNPDTGESWGPGEMATYFEAHGPGVVNEALMTTAYNRAGDCELSIQPYLIEGRRLRWFSEEQSFDGHGGLVHDALTKIMSEPTVLQAALLAAPEFQGMDHERALVTCDMATLTALTTKIDSEMAVLMMAEVGTRRHQLLRERLGRGMIADPSDWN